MFEVLIGGKSTRETSSSGQNKQTAEQPANKPVALASEFERRKYEISLNRVLEHAKSLDW